MYVIIFEEFRLQKCFKPVRVLLKSIKELTDMIPVCRRVVAGNRQRKKCFPISLHKFSCLNRRKIIGFVLIGMDGEMLEGDPRNTGYGIGVLRREPVLPCQNAMLTAVFSLVFQIALIKYAEILIIFRPHQRKGFVVLVKYRIQWGQCIIIADLTVFFRDFKRLLPI